MPCERSVVGHCDRRRERFLRRTNAPALNRNPRRPAARHLMHQMAVDVDQARAIGFGMDEMIVPDFIIEGARLRHRAIPAAGCGSCKNTI